MKKLDNKDYIITIIGVGYVGLPLINEFSKSKKVFAYDIDVEKIKKLKINNINKNIEYTSDETCIKESDAIIVAVPTPTHKNNSPDLDFVIQASKTIGLNLKKKSLIVFESSYYPGVTEEICIPLIEKFSGLTENKDFFVGYSPERINPVDDVHTINNVTKIISAKNRRVLKKIEELYNLIPNIRLYKVDSIKVAELSKIVENSQRDLNIAFVNEVSQLCHKMKISTSEVLKAASTKWNFVDVYPGLVGGHCIGIDPYYLISLGKKYDFNMNLVMEARKDNENMPYFIVDNLIKILESINEIDPRIGIFGYSYKADSDDIRNTKVKAIYEELINRNYRCFISDYNLFGKKLCFKNYKHLNNIDVLIVAVPHKKYRIMKKNEIINLFRKSCPQKIIIDLYSIYNNYDFGDDFIYWKL